MMGSRVQRVLSAPEDQRDPWGVWDPKALLATLERAERRAAQALQVIGESMEKMERKEPPAPLVQPDLPEREGNKDPRDNTDSRVYQGSRAHPESQGNQAKRGSLEREEPLAQQVREASEAPQVREEAWAPMASEDLREARVAPVWTGPRGPLVHLAPVVKEGPRACRGCLEREAYRAPLAPREIQVPWEKKAWRAKLDRTERED